MTKEKHPVPLDDGPVDIIAVGLRPPPPSIKLRHLVPTDRLAIRRWMRDPAVIDFTVVVPGPECTRDDVACVDADQYFRSLLLDHRRRAFAIIHNGLHVGNVGLRELELDQGHAECFIEIGEAHARGHGVGHAAMAQVIDYGFVDLGLDVIRLGVFEFNTAARNLYSRLGFELTERCGLHWSRGRYWDVLGMALTRAKWAAARGQHLAGVSEALTPCAQSGSRPS